jgi:hypothetical protein
MTIFDTIKYINFGLNVIIPDFAITLKIAQIRLGINIHKNANVISLLNWSS